MALNETCTCGQNFKTFLPAIGCVPDKDGVCYAHRQSWPCKNTMAHHDEWEHSLSFLWTRLDDVECENPQWVSGPTPDDPRQSYGIIGSMDCGECWPCVDRAALRKIQQLLVSYDRIKAFPMDYALNRAAGVKGVRIPLEADDA